MPTSFQGRKKQNIIIMHWFQNFSGNWGNSMMWGNWGNSIWSGGWGIMGSSLFLLFLLWSLFWKGAALWKAAREEGSVGWFVALLLLNTFGILEILYIFTFSKKKGFPKF